MSDLSQQFGRVAVLMGGTSAERDVSLVSGQAVLEGLKRKGVDAHALDTADSEVLQKLGEFDGVFNVLHGRGGEDGVIQGVLEMMAKPYTGSGVLGSALAMDKLRSKQIWKAMSLPTPEWALMREAAEAPDIAERLGMPVFVKPPHEGSSIGMSRVNRAEDLPAAFELASRYDDAVLVEKFVDGEEYTFSILDGKALPGIRLRTENEFYDYEAKYESDDTEYLCPCGLEAGTEARFQALAVQAFEALDASGWGRVDMMVDGDGMPWLIEANTVPGMTSHSLVPMAAKQAGIGFDELVIRILASAYAKQGGRVHGQV